jgi:hypothetical protein
VGVECGARAESGSRPAAAPAGSFVGVTPSRPAAARAAAASSAAVCLLLSEVVLSGAVAAGVAVAGYAVLAALALGLRRHPGLVAAAGGLAANAGVVALNGAMPVRSLSPWSASHLHRGLRTGDRLAGLADVIRLPGTHTMVSAGDVVLVVGAVAALTAALIDRSPWLARHFRSVSGHIGGSGSVV